MDEKVSPQPPPPQNGPLGGDKKSIPAPRNAGEQPRTHAVDTNRALGKPALTEQVQTAPETSRVEGPDRLPTHLPDRRGPREAAARDVPAPAAVMPTALDLHKMERGGLHGFACPACGRPLWVKKKDSGAAMTCESCSSEVTAPNFETGASPRVLSRPESAPRAKTVLPEHRHSDPPIGKRIQAKKTEAPVEAPSKLPAAEPALARPTPEESPVAEAAAATENTTSSESVSRAAANFRLAENRRLRLMPKGDVEGDPEVYQGWGLDLDAAELRRRKNRRIIVASVALALPLLGILIWLALMHHFNPPPVAEATGMSDGTKAAEEVRRAVAVAKTFLGAPTSEEQAKFVRHPEVTTARMQEWHKSRPYRPYQTLGFDSRTEEQTIDEVPFVMLFVTRDDHAVKAIALEKSGADFKVDWESYIGWTAIPWSQFLSTEPSEPHEMRVVIQHDTYYNFYYADDARYFCYKLVDPENSAHCFAYTGLESAAGQKINQMIRRQRHAGDERVKAILKLHFEPAARGHLQAWVDDVVQDGWVKIAP